MRILVRTSKIAIWARRFALFGAALIVISTGLHFFEQIAADVYKISLIIGSICAIAAFLVGIAAYIRLWFTGDRGWGPASVGFVLGLACLAPAGVAAALAEMYPSTADVSTAFTNPPQLLRARPNHPAIDPETVLATFPNLITRIYRIPPQILFALGENLARANGWRIIAATPPSENGPGTLNAIRRSHLGFENEIVFRISPNPIGALIDLRAASLVPVIHDLGDNGRAIESFLLALDGAVSSHVQNNMAETEIEPAVSSVPEEEASAQ